MQSKGAIKFLSIVLAIACAYQLSFTFVTRNVEQKAVKYAAGDPAKEQAYIDSMKPQVVYNLGFVKYTYKEAKEKEINLGLDLKGGMNVMLEIQIEDILKALSNNNPDPEFNMAMAMAKEAQKTSTRDYITLFRDAYEEVAPGKSLSFIFNTPELREKVSPGSTNQQVVDVLRAESESAIANSYMVIRSRIDRFGVTQPNIQRLEGSGRILVELPGVKEPERVRKLLQGTASLEFWPAYKNEEVAPIFEQVNTYLKQYNELQAPQQEEQAKPEAPAGEESVLDSLDAFSVANAEADMSEEQFAKEYPLYSKLSPVTDQTGRYAHSSAVGHARSYDTTAVMAYLALPQVKAMFPRDVEFMWGVKGIDPAETIFPLYAIKKNTRDGRPPLDGSAVVEAREGYSERGSTAEVSMSMNATGARQWARLTADNVGGFVAVCLDGYVYSAPGVSEEITGGQSRISGAFTINEARDLANVLKSGKLPAPARIIQEAVVGPSLGQEAINSGLMSFVIAFLLVLVYMMLFYNKAGMVASIALICNIFFLFGVLVSFGAVLTLPGIAGIVLTMGMAVDANVIIYERIKEEIKAGKGLSLSIVDGFKNAYSAIIDGNVTTLITGIVLFIFGTGPVQGFATTLIIGIITSLFTSIFITRIIFVSMLEKGRNITFSNKFTANFLANTKIDFIKLRKISYVVSGALVLIAIVSLVVRGVNYGVDFSGGRAYVVRFDQNVSDNDVRSALDKVFVSDDGATESFELKQYGAESMFQKRIVTQYKYDDESDEASEEIEKLLYGAMSQFYTYPITENSFRTTQNDPNGVISADKVGPSVANDIKVNSLIAMLFSLLAIGIYIAIRFKKWYWATGGVVSLAHDAFLTIGLFSLFYGVFPFALEVDQSFIAAILTIIGYSINDKVVIFDRIREYHILYPKRNAKENINNAINSTLSRTVNTSGTTFVTLLAIFLFGGDVIRGFIFALMFGIIIGTLSSIFVATPIAYDLMRKSTKREEA